MKPVQEQSTQQRTGFRLRLQAEFARRSAKNPRYSLRSFARYLAIDHSTLSQLLRGKRLFTDAVIASFGAKLKLSRDEIKWFQSQEYLQRFSADITMLDTCRIILDTSSLLHDPLHFAILDLMRLEEFQADSSWIARMVDSRIDEVNIALSRLVRSGLLEMVGPKKWRDTSGVEEFSVEGFSRTVMKRLGRQLRDGGSVSVVPINHQ